MFPPILFPVANLNLDISKFILWDVVIITFIGIVNSVLSFSSTVITQREKIRNAYQMFRIDLILTKTIANNFIFFVYF